MTLKGLPSSFAAWIVILLALPAVSQAQLYVDQNAEGPTHDGTTWCTGFLTLEEALAVANPGDVIRVANGVYVPDPTGLADPRAATFEIAADLVVMGGFSGCGGEQPHLWDPFGQPVTFSGDLAGDDPADTSDNAYHVMTANESGDEIALIGMTVSGGRADGTGSDAQGGGLLALGSQVGMALVHFRDNHAWRGGAIYAEGGAVTLRQSSACDNHASGEGGAIFHTSNLDALDCLFASNSAVSDGGAIFSDLCTARFLGCTLANNVSTGRGGGLYEYVGVEGQVLNGIVWGNEDMFGTGEESQLFVNPSNSLWVEYSCVQGWTGGFGGEGNIGDDPLFLEPQVGDFHVSEHSPTVEAGDTELVETQRDLDDNPRIQMEVDMGCYERLFTSGRPEVVRTLDRNYIESVLASSQWLQIRYQLDSAVTGTPVLRVYDSLGRRVTQLPVDSRAKTDRVQWDGRDRIGRRLPSGVYLIALESGGLVLDSKKAAWVR